MAATSLENVYSCAFAMENGDTNANSLNARKLGFCFKTEEERESPNTRCYLCCCFFVIIRQRMSSSARQTPRENNAQRRENKSILEEKEEKYLFVNGESIAHNVQINSKTFTSLSILSGSIAGILGATDWIGLVWYCGTILVVGGVTIVFRCKNEPKRFAPESVGSAIFGQGFSGGFASFILFWTLFYNVCHLF